MKELKLFQNLHKYCKPSTKKVQSQVTDMSCEADNCCEKPPVENGPSKVQNYASIEIKSKKTNVDPHTFAVTDMKPTTYLETFTNMIKGNIGCGLLAMGMAYKNGGLLLSTILVLVVGTISCYNQYILVKMATEFQELYKCGHLSFSRTISFAFQKGPKPFQRLANFVWFTIEMFIILTQLGFCCVYFMFVASSLKQIFDNYEIYISISCFMTIALPIFWITSLIRELKYIAPLSTLANVSIFASLGLVLVCNVQNLGSLSERALIGKWENIPLCFGTVVYALEGISLVLPLQQNMRDKERFLGAFGVLNLSLGVVVFLMITLGFFGYYKNGEDVAASLSFNLDIKNIVTQVVISSMVFSILFTYALQFFLPVLILLPWVRKHTSTWPFSCLHLYEYILRSVLVIITYLVAMNVPHFDLFVSLIGAVGSSFLALIYTPLADLALVQHRKESYRSWRVLIATISISVGVIGFLVGTTVSLKELIAAVQKDHNTNLLQ